MGFCAEVQWICNATTPHKSRLVRTKVKNHRARRVESQAHFCRFFFTSFGPLLRREEDGRAVRWERNLAYGCGLQG
jgi:hypothetical protein